MNESILVVEDERALQTVLGDRLRSEGYTLDMAWDGFEAFDKASNLPFDLVILDLVLPRKSGLDVCRDLRANGIATPILILSGRNEVVDKVIGLKLGADDYLTKPFEMAELLARVEVLLRRVPIRSGHGAFSFGAIRVDMRHSEITRDGTPVYLTAREFQLLRYLLERAGRTVSRNELLRSVWGYDSETLTRTVDTHVSSLRQKLEASPKQPEFILTVSGVGYKFMGSRDK